MPSTGFCRERGKESEDGTCQSDRPRSEAARLGPIRVHVSSTIVRVAGAGRHED